MRFASVFDERLFHEGPPAIFTLDPRGQLRVDPERSREIYMMLDPGARAPGFYVFTDRATGVRMLAVVTHPAMAERQPRALVQRFADYASAAAQAVQEWPVAAPDAVTRA
ncbi:MAG: hypothetical protein FJ102_17290 [Deltaproteobacteria bacterium]|nr:hypothetical protein [Deltaproteobacteria bacterium]